MMIDKIYDCVAHTCSVSSVNAYSKPTQRNFSPAEAVLHRFTSNSHPAPATLEAASTFSITTELQQNPSLIIPVTAHKNSHV